MPAHYGTLQTDQNNCYLQKSHNRMNEERQPLLLGGGSDSESVNQDHVPAARPDIRCSPETALLDVVTNMDDAPAAILRAGKDPENPMMNRTLEHPTSNLDTMIHLLKANIGTGILAMPDAFRNAGLLVGLFGTLLMGLICTHCMHILVRCSHELCNRCQVPSLGFSDVVFVAFQTGPTKTRSYAQFMKILINVFLCITQIGFCCVYFVFVAANLQGVIAHYYVQLDVHVYLLLLLIPMIFLNWVKNLKYLTPVSLFAAVLTVVGLAVTFFYMLQDLPKTSTVNNFAGWEQLPLYFGTAIYAFEGIGVILPLENNMRTPQDFGGLTGVLNTSMVIVACLYTAVGYFGYLKYGDAVKLGSITLNLPPSDILAQSVRVMMALAIFLSYGLQFYVPMNILWPLISDRFTTERHKQIGEYVTRTGLVIFTFLLAAIIPNLSTVISLVGAVSSSALAIVFPSLIEIITFWPDKLGKFKWMLWKDVAIIIFGLLGFVFGTYTSLAKIFYPDL